MGFYHSVRYIGSVSIFLSYGVPFSIIQLDTVTLTKLSFQVPIALLATLRLSETG